MGIRQDLRVLYHMVFTRGRGDTHAQRMENFFSPENHLKKSLDIYDNLGDVYSFHLNNTNLGLILLRQGDISKAETKIREARRLFEERPLGSQLGRV